MSQKAQKLNEFNSSVVSKKGTLACHGYSFEDYPDAFDMHPFTNRANSLGTGNVFHSIGSSSLNCLLVKNCCYQISKLELNLYELDLIFTSYLIIQISV